METTWTTCRPNQRKLAIWFAVTSGISGAMVICFMWINIQASMLLLGALSLVITACGGLLMRSRFRYNDKQVQSRYFRNIERTWADVDSWSLIMGRRIGLYVRFSDGVTVGSNQWILSEREIGELIPLLLAKIGKPKKAEQTILPWPYTALITTVPRKPENGE